MKKRISRRQPAKKSKRSETDWYFIGGKWITAEERQAEMSTLQADISQIEETFRVCNEVQKSVRDLIRLAREAGDRDLPTRTKRKSRDELVTHILWSTACDTVSGLNSIAAKRPELLLDLSRNLFSWPAFVSRKRALRIETVKLMHRLQLGEGEVYSQREWRLSAPSTQYALRLFVAAQICKKAWDLPPLTRKNKRTWFEASWRQMLRQGIVPEESPFLAPLGKSAIGKKSISRGMSEQTEGMRRDDVRAEIKRQVWNAFNRLIAGAGR